MNHEGHPKRILDLVFPDWGVLDDQLRSREPFALWQVGDQHVIYHWLDHALNQGYDKVRVWSADRPDQVRKVLTNATLWPLAWEVVPVGSPAEAPGSAVDGARLPWMKEATPAPGDGWTLLDYWFALENDWFAWSYDRAEVQNLNLAIGRFCHIHPSVRIQMPVWIGNNVYIGEGSEIGPNASIGHGCVLAGENVVVDSKISKHTFLGAKTEVNRCYLNGGLLLNLRHRGKVPKVDQFIADTWVRSPQKPGCIERGIALILWIALKGRHLFDRSCGESRDFETFQGERIATYANAPLWKERLPWLLEVVRGNYFLFGVLPRNREQLSLLSEDWQDILSSAPVGVFSYADTHGCHSPDDEMEALHAVYQAAQPREKFIDVCREFAWQVIKGGLWSRSTGNVNS